LFWSTKAPLLNKQISMATSYFCATMQDSSIGERRQPFCSSSISRKPLTQWCSNISWNLYNTLGSRPVFVIGLWRFFTPLLRECFSMVL
jgi:hypothetical protein